MTVAKQHNDQKIHDVETVVQVHHVYRCVEQMHSKTLIVHVVCKFKSFKAVPSVYT